MSKIDEIINIRLTKKHLTYALIAVVAASLIIPYQIFAQNGGGGGGGPTEEVTPEAPGDDVSIQVNRISAELTNNLAGVESWYDIRFRTQITGMIKTIEFSFEPAGDVSGATLISKSGIGNGVLTTDPGAGAVIYTVNNPVSVPAGTNIKFLLSRIGNPLFEEPDGNAIAIIIKDNNGSNLDFGVAEPIPHQVVTSEMIGDNSIRTDDIEDFTFPGTGIQTSDLADNAINTSKILNGAVTSLDLGANSVGSSKVLDGSLTGADIADSSVTLLDISSIRLGTTGPLAAGSAFTIFDERIDVLSAIVVTIDGNTGDSVVCGVYDIIEDGLTDRALVKCGEGSVQANSLARYAIVGADG